MSILPQLEACLRNSSKKKHVLPAQEHWEQRPGRALSQPTHGLTHFWARWKQGQRQGSFPKQWTEGGLPVPSSAISQEVGICVPFMGRSVTCPVAHCTLKCTISKPPNLHKMHFSVALLERKRSALPRPQAPWGDRISNKQNCVDIWTMVGPAHSGERAKNSLW